MATLLLCGRRDARNRVAIRACDRHSVADGEDFGMIWNGEVWLDHQAACAVCWSTQPFSGRRSLHTHRPDDGFGGEPLSPVGNAAGSAFGNGMPEFYLDTQSFQGALGI